MEYQPPNRRFRYSAWDGTQTGFELDARDVMADITDDVLYHGDLDAALRRLLQDGMETPDGERIQGLRELMDRLRERRRDLLDQHDLGGVYDDIAQSLRDVVDTERAALDEQLAEAEASGNERRTDLARESVEAHRMDLDLLSPDLAGMVRDLSDYDFTSGQAQKDFAELMDKLRSQLMANQVNQMMGQMSQITPDDLKRNADMMAELNEMIAARERGDEPDFDGFLDRYGDLFGEPPPKNLDELLEQMAQRFAAMQAMLNSMTPEQRAQMQQLTEQLLEDLDMSWEFQRLSEQLQNLYPQLGWQRSYEFSGNDPLDFAGAPGLFDQLGDLDQLENLIRSSANPGALAEADIERAKRLLGPDAARSLERLAELTKLLTEAGLVEQREGRLELTSAGLRRIGKNALAELFSALSEDRFGAHRIERTGQGHERSDETRPYVFGDPFNLDIQRTLRNALGRRGPGVPVRLEPDDFEIAETTRSVRTATVLMVDLSLSMPMQDNFLPAKKVAMALHSLISSQFPRDYLGLVGFSEVARIIEPAELPAVSWDYVYGTNMQHGFVLARRLLARERGTKQIIMITDGEPTAHITESGEVLFNYPPIRATVDATLTEVARCTRADITINTFMLGGSHGLGVFIERLTQMNRGRAFFTTPQNLGDYVLVDFLESRRRLTRRRAG
ncbi:MAG TPA: hypothetical protein VFN21_03875 [Acidimicrobiales bacterium]|nr:hypothetical protein [Acidimicrobiales bacterium]